MIPTIIPAILARHAEEAAFLWLLRDRAVVRPQYTLRSLTELDQRVEAHLDGLRVAGEHGWRRAWQEFEERPEPGEAFAAAVLAFESADPERIQKLIAASAVPRLIRAVVSAVGWLTDDAAAIALPVLASFPEPLACRIGIAGAGVRRVWMGWSAIEKHLVDPHGSTCSRAIECIGQLGITEGLPMVRKHLNSDDLTVRFAAAWTVARLALDAAAIQELQSIVMTEPHFRQQSATMAIRRLDLGAARRWIEMLAQTPGCERLAIQAAGARGDPVFVPLLLERMADPLFARLSGESLSMITGVKLARSKLDACQPAGFEAGPNDDPNDSDVDLDPDDGLDWPDAELVKKWWDSDRGRFRAGTRYLCGKPIAPDHLKAILQTGYQRQRAAAALELAILSPRQPLLEVRAPGWRQGG